MKTEEIKFHMTTDAVVRVAQILYDSGVDIEELEYCTGGKVKAVEDGVVVWECQPVRVIRFKKGQYAKFKD